MLLGIPGDNTYSNYAEANRAFYRQTVVPLLARIATALGAWLGGSFGGSLRLVPDLDEIPALSVEREALWKRLGDASFLTDDEKRAAVGYEPLPASSLTTLLAKYHPNQPRVPAGNPDGGQWTSGGYGVGNERVFSDEIRMNWCRARSMRRTIRVAKRREFLERRAVTSFLIISRLAREISPVPHSGSTHTASFVVIGKVVWLRWNLIR